LRERGPAFDRRVDIRDRESLAFHWGCKICMFPSTMSLFRGSLLSVNATSFSNCAVATRGIA
jgi:hypothetical protein